MQNTYLEEYLDYLKYERSLSENTILAYKRDIKDFINFYEYFNPNQITIENISSYTKNLSKSNIKPSSIVRKIASIKGFFRFLNRRKKIKNNPTSNAQTPKLPKKLPTVITKDEINRILNTNMPILEHTILEVLYSTGLRVSELVNLKLTNVDLKNNNIKTFGKGSKERIIPIGTYANSTIKEYLKTREKILTLNNKTSEFLFINDLGDQISRQFVYLIIKKMGKLIGKNISPHTIRHTTATHMLENGADIRTVQEILGHVSVVTTQIYTHISKTKLKEIYKNIIG